MVIPARENGDTGAREVHTGGGSWSDPRRLLHSLVELNREARWSRSRGHGSEVLACVALSGYRRLNRGREGGVAAMVVGGRFGVNSAATEPTPTRGMAANGFGLMNVSLGVSSKPT